jgi:hypothetical protein
MTTPQHCPGYEQFKHLKSFTCKCPGCGEEKEIFSDEFEKNIHAPNADRKSILRSVHSTAVPEQKFE